MLVITLQKQSPKEFVILIKGEHYFFLFMFPLVGHVNLGHFELCMTQLFVKKYRQNSCLTFCRKLLKGGTSHNSLYN